MSNLETAGGELMKKGSQLCLRWEEDYDESIGWKHGWTCDDSTTAWVELPGPLVKEQLDGLNCPCGEARHSGEHPPLCLGAPCHPSKGVVVFYDAGVLELCCRECWRSLALIAVRGRL